ncbi:MAG: hypothetical protein N6V49_07820, partial [Serratia symbiotica]|nr:hypothetical protein [Serratia symbiotica]
MCATIDRLNFQTSPHTQRVMTGRTSGIIAAIIARSTQDLCISVGDRLECGARNAILVIKLTTPKQN